MRNTRPSRPRSLADGRSAYPGCPTAQPSDLVRRWAGQQHGDLEPDPGARHRRTLWSVLSWQRGGEKVGEQLRDTFMPVVVDPVRGVGQALDAVEVGDVSVIGLG
jgi:hypothetical protein